MGRRLLMTIVQEAIHSAKEAAQKVIEKKATW